MLTEKQTTNFLQKIKVNPISECWEWQGFIDSKGYGHANIRSLGGKKLAHRVSLAIYLGFDLNSSKCVCHKCDNPRCCNPSHLFIGSQADNMRDMIVKGRGSRYSVGGEENGNSKLSEKSILEIKLLLSSLNNKEIALRYDVTRSTISAVRAGKTWAKITGIETPIKCLPKKKITKPKDVFKKASKWPPKGIGIQNGKFITRINVNGESKYLGVHGDVFEARAAWMRTYNKNNLTYTIHC